MRGLNNITIRTGTVVTSAVIALLILAALVFLYILATSFIKPFFLGELVSSTSITLDSSFDEVVQNLSDREALPAGRQDLTVASPSATLSQGTTFTAEIINGSSIPGAARNLADALNTLGITVSQVGNSLSEEINTVIGLKAKSEIARESIVEKIGTKSGELLFEKLEDSYPFDIRIVIGR